MNDLFSQALKTALSIGLCPQDFWNLSLREWREITKPSGAMKHQDFQELAKIFEEKNEE